VDGTILFIGMLVIGIFTVDGVVRWWRLKEWQRRWRTRS
jgi:hypothetical protein